MSSDPAAAAGLRRGQIRFDDVTKVYEPGGPPWRLRRGAPAPRPALADVSIDVDPGECVAVIGPNGAGKSTLLRLLAGIHGPTRGSVAHRGVLGQMIELGVGFDGELTGRENLHLSSILLGLDPGVTDDRLDAILAFADIGDAVDAPVKHYSTGMRTRLGFALVTHHPIDILLVDEVLSVGDQDFQARCTARMAELVRAGTTVLLVTHEMLLVETFVDRAILLEDGRVTADGEPDAVVEQYVGRSRRAPAPAPDGTATITGLEVTPTIRPWDPIAIDLDVDLQRPLARVDAIVEVSLANLASDGAFARERHALPGVSGPGHHRVTATTGPIPMTGGLTRLVVTLVDPDGERLLDAAEAEVRVVGESDTGAPQLAAVPAFTLTPPGDEAPAAPHGPGATTGERVLSVEDGTKAFRRRRHSTDLRLARPGRPPLPSDPILALDHVDVAAAQGESLGVIGANGAGKSTLLRVVAGVSGLTRGRVAVEGRVVSVLELGVGFHPEQTGRENVRLSATIMGMAAAELEHRLEEIAAFSGIGDAIDQPVKRYSSGMRARLGFALAAHMDCDVLLLDELLAVGDHEFRAQAIKHLHRLRNRGTTVVFVSHNLPLVLDVCERAVRLERGRIVDEGPVGDVVQRYVGSRWDSSHATEDSAVRFVDVHLDRTKVACDDPLAIRGEIVVERPAPELRLALTYRLPPPDPTLRWAPHRPPVYTLLVARLGARRGSLDRTGTHSFEAVVPRNRLQGRFEVAISALDDGDGSVKAEAWDVVSVGEWDDPNPVGLPLDLEWRPGARTAP